MPYFSTDTRRDDDAFLGLSLSSYVLRSIDEVVKDFIAPKSYTIDVGHLLGGNLGPEEAYSIGILVVVIHQATDLPAADTNG